jgi:hypothetical protein
MVGILSPRLYGGDFGEGVCVDLSPQQFHVNMALAILPDEGRTRLSRDKHKD